MITTKKAKEGDALVFMDGVSEQLKASDPVVFELVQAGMRAGLTEFTTPTSDDGEGRMDWKVRRWLTKRGDRVACFLVAYQETNAHYEVVGPEVKMGGEAKDASKTGEPAKTA